MKDGVAAILSGLELIIHLHGMAPYKELTLYIVALVYNFRAQ